jgi:hypothetical protein
LYDERFVWDKEKYALNLQKHKITFEEASTVFADGNAVYLEDEGHSQDEERFNVIGMSDKLKILMVCHCYRNGDRFIRVISARKATKSEERLYRR